jgi:hypothetical protein
MSIELDLPPELESELAAEAERLGMSLAVYAVHLLAAGRGTNSAPRTGAELTAYWRAENLVGTRQDIADGPAHARAVREESQLRSRP